MSDWDNQRKELTTLTVPPVRRGLSAAVLKYIAAALMLIDHTGASVLRKLYFSYFHTTVLLHCRQMCGYISRPAFPIFCFLTVESFLRMKDDPPRLRRFLLRLGVFALLSEGPFDLALGGQWFDAGSQNVFWTLLLGMMGLCCLDKLLQRPGRVWLRCIPAAAVIAFFASAAAVLHCDYGWCGIAVIVIFYLLHRYRAPAAVLACPPLITIRLYEWTSVFAAPLICLYDGRRGRQNKWFFYAFYPAHLLLLGLIRKYLL